MSSVPVAIIGAGPYGLSVAAHLAARNVPHRIFGEPMRFWKQIAAAGDGRFLKSFCFGTDLSTPRSGYRFADYSRPRGLETFEPCSISDFADYGRWFQQEIVPHVEPVHVRQVERRGTGFVLTLESGEVLDAAQVIVATGLSCYANVPSVLAALPLDRVTHTAQVTSFAAFERKRVAVIGAGQSALEAAAVLLEAGAQPILLVRDDKLLWQTAVSPRRTLWKRVRSPISKLGSGPKAWVLTNLPGMLHHWPDAVRVPFTKNHLPPEGAWWLRERVEGLIPVRLGTTVVGARMTDSTVCLSLRDSDAEVDELHADHVIAGSGYGIDVERLEFLAPSLRREVATVEGAPRLDSTFESSVPGLRFVGPSSAMCFGPLFRFVVGAQYSARVVSTQLAASTQRAGTRVRATSN